MIYVLFFISIAIYLIYLYFKKKRVKEGFITNPEKRQYFYIGNFRRNLDLYLQSYENKNGKETLDYTREGCNYDSKLFLDKNKDKSKDLLKIKFYNIKENDIIKSKKIGDILKNDEFFFSNIRDNAVIVFSFGENDLDEINKIQPGKENDNNGEEEVDLDSLKKYKRISESEREQIKAKLEKNTEETEDTGEKEGINKLTQDKNEIKKKCKKALNKINLYAIEDNYFKFKKKPLNGIKYLFLNLEESQHEDYKIWNEALKEYVDETNAIFNGDSTKDNSKTYLKIIDSSKNNVNHNGEQVDNGIPYDLHLFICKNERCDIGNEDCINKFPKLYNKI